MHSSFWGGDMEALILQGAPRGLFKRSTVVMTAGEPAMFRLGTQIPNGTVIGARGPLGMFAPDTAAEQLVPHSLFGALGTPPGYPVIQDGAGDPRLEGGDEKAAAGKPRDACDRMPVIAAFEGL